jgi:hypothetical protein
VHQHSSEPKFDLDAAKKALEAIEAERLKAEVLKGYSRGTKGGLKGYSSRAVSRGTQGVSKGRGTQGT